ncbi:MAG: 3-phosphoshikimate 1-carboxyvinyltransferase [Actinomycetota bacterium]|nr:3-phosphoshikimate 1-carboxyvinyltransferase [Actinomycetota bacterium]
MSAPAADAVEDPYEILPFEHELDAIVQPPGSKSITNRALVCAALARGTSTLEGVLFADDTEAMIACLRELGVPMRVDTAAATVEVRGTRGEPPVEGALLDARLSGTTSRFVMPVAALGRATVVLDGAEPLRRRPMGDLLRALRGLGASITELGETGMLPVQIDADHLEGGRISVRGDVSSQFLSALLLSAPCMDEGLQVELETELVSRPYVDMTLRVMDAFGAHSTVGDRSQIAVLPTGYRSCERYSIEPDASAASYFFAAAAIRGGTVRVEGLGTASLQGDVAFVDALERMGARVRRSEHSIEVTGTGELRGIEADFADISDTAQTIAAVAVHATTPTRITGIGFIRGKETDRVAAVVTELQRCGIEATQDDDGFTVVPGTPRPAVVQTYDDHRMAMSFALLGLRHPGISIADPGCVAKTVPDYWTRLDALRR